MTVAGHPPGGAPAFFFPPFQASIPARRPLYPLFGSEVSHVDFSAHEEATAASLRRRARGRRGASARPCGAVGEDSPDALAAAVGLRLGMTPRRRQFLPLPCIQGRG